MKLLKKNKLRILDQMRAAFEGVREFPVDRAKKRDDPNRLTHVEWMRKFLPHYVQAPFGEFQHWLADQMDHMRTHRPYRLNVMAPRRHAKSSIVSLAQCLRGALEGSESYVWIVSNVITKAQQELKNVREEIEQNAALAEAYPGVCGVGKPWRAKSLTLLNGTTIEAMSMREAIRGRRERAKRPSLIVCDDIQSDDAMHSHDVRQRDKEWFEGSLLPAGGRYTNVVNLGTAMHRECIGSYLLRYPQWRSKVWRAVIAEPERKDLWAAWEGIFFDLEDDGRHERADEFFDQNRLEMERGSRVLWPEWMPLVELMKVRAETRNAYEREFQMREFDPEGREWPPECFEDHVWMKAGESFPAGEFRAVACDPSKGADARRGDYSAIVGIAKTPHNIFVRSDLKRRPSSQIVEDLFVFCEDFKPHYLGFETNASQELFIPLIRQYAEKPPGNGMYLRQLLTQGDPVYALDNRVQKDVRIRRLDRYVMRHQLKFERSVSNALLVDQLRDFPDKDAHDDGPDALEMAIRTPLVAQGYVVEGMAKQRMTSGR